MVVVWAVNVVLAVIMVEIMVVFEVLFLHYSCGSVHSGYI